MKDKKLLMAIIWGVVTGIIIGLWGWIGAIIVAFVTSAIIVGSGIGEVIVTLFNKRD